MKFWSLKILKYLQKTRMSINLKVKRVEYQKLRELRMSQLMMKYDSMTSHILPTEAGVRAAWPDGEKQIFILNKQTRIRQSPGYM